MPKNSISSFAAAAEAHENGRLADAERHCREFLRSEPENLSANLLLGVVLAKTGRTAEAIEVLRQVEHIDPASFEALNWLSILLRRSGSVEDATRYAERAVELKPNDAEGLNNLGLCQFAAHKYADAESSLRHALSLDSKTAMLHHNHALALMHLGRDEEAATGFQQAIRLAPNSVLSYLYLSQMALGHGNAAAAATYARQAVTINPNSSAGHSVLGYALMNLGSSATAEQHLRTAVKIDPNAGTAHGMLGLGLQARGEWQEARHHLERSIASLPSQGLAYWGLVQGRKMSSEDGDLLDAISKVIDRGDCSPKELSYLHYALGKSSNDLGNYQEAMAHYDDANRLCHLAYHSRTPFDSEAYGTGFARTIEIFTPEFIARHQHLGDPSAKPVFIVGQIRSGTTLTEQIISSHPNVAGAGELTYLLHHGPGTYDVKTHALVPERVQRLANEYLALLDNVGLDTERVTDKLPSNIQMLGLIQIAFPNASIIHLKRQPVDNCLSIYMTPYGLPVDFAYVKENIVFAYRRYQELSDHWRRTLPPGRVLEISYEELIADRERVTRAMVAYCGLKWSDACLSHEDNERTVNTPSVWQVRQPIYKTSVDRWKRYEPWLGAFRELIDPAAQSVEEHSQ